MPPACEAIATYSSRPGFSVDADDVIIASGCSGAVELVMTALVDQGDNILVPSPGFPLYQVMIDSLGGVTKHYPLIADQGWECDIAAMEALIDSRTRAILVNNPSNPCGANYSRKHCEAVAALARKYSLPIIADEIYAGIVFSEEGFTPMNVCSGDVPVISLGGLAKEFCVPGWRVGWVVVHDRDGRLTDIKTGIKQLTQLIVGANSIVQACIPRVLTPAAGSDDEKSLAEYAEKYVNLLSSNAKVCVAEGAKSDALEVLEPQGAMYAMVRVSLDKLEGVKDDTDFAAQLLQEENLFVLPGSCFGISGFVRILTCPSAEVIQEAMERMNAFCARKAGKGREHESNKRKHE